MYNEQPDSFSLAREPPAGSRVDETIFRRFCAIVEAQAAETDRRLLQEYIRKCVKLIGSVDIELGLVSLLVESVNWSGFSGTLNLTSEADFKLYDNDRLRRAYSRLFGS